MKELYVVLLLNRELLEGIENETFNSIKEMTDRLDSDGMTSNEADDLGYYEISEFVELVNDQVLDNLEGIFITYVYINK